MQGMRHIGYLQHRSFGQLLAIHRHTFTASKLLEGLPYDDDVRDRYRTATAELLADAREEIATRASLCDWFRIGGYGGWG